MTIIWKSCACCATKILCEYHLGVYGVNKNFNAKIWKSWLSEWQHIYPLSICLSPADMQCHTSYCTEKLNGHSSICHSIVKVTKSWLSDAEMIQNYTVQPKGMCQGECSFLRWLVSHSHQWSSKAQNKLSYQN